MGPEQDREAGFLWPLLRVKSIIDENHGHKQDGSYTSATKMFGNHTVITFQGKEHEDHSMSECDIAVEYQDEEKISFLVGPSGIKSIDAPNLTLGVGNAKLSKEQLQKKIDALTPQKRLVTTGELLDWVEKVQAEGQYSGPPVLDHIFR